ncbi:hypothetical protein Holit_00110 [Hollandina sp. SP2]
MQFDTYLTRKIPPAKGRQGLRMSVITKTMATKLSSIAALTLTAMVCMICFDNRIRCGISVILFRCLRRISGE